MKHPEARRPRQPAAVAGRSLPRRLAATGLLWRSAAAAQLDGGSNVRSVGADDHESTGREANLRTAIWDAWIAGAHR